MGWTRWAIAFIQCLTYLYDFITYPLYYVIEKPWEKLESARRRKAFSKNGPQGPYFGLHHMDDALRNTVAKMNSMYEVFEHFANIHKIAPILGTREILSEENETQADGRVFKKLVLGCYNWLSYEEVVEKVNNFANALAHLGQKSSRNVVIFAETRAEWLIAAIACFKMNIPVVTLYTTLGEEAIVFAVNEAKADLVITSHDVLPIFKTMLAKTPLVKTIIYMEGMKKVVADWLPSGIALISFNKVQAMGKSVGPAICQGATRKDPAIIMYTSGSTGEPKGVIITQHNLLSALSGFGGLAPVLPHDRYIAYLPLAHVLELFLEFCCIAYGVPIGYSSTLTMFDKASKVKRGCQGDATILKPTIMGTVPLILDRVYKSVTDAVAQKGEFGKAVFDFAYQYKRGWMAKGFSTPITDRLVFKKLRDLLGGNIRVLIAGGAPLVQETHEFTRICFGGAVLQGFGMTETCACSTLTPMDDMSVGTVGVPLPGVQVMLQDWEEGGYRITDKPHPRGELCVGGGVVTAGYYNADHLNEEAFFEDYGTRWVRSGDICEILEDGSIRMIDRKKDLVKLQMGEYVSLGKVEAQLKTIGIVDNVCVFGDSNKNYTVAIIVPDATQLKTVGEKLKKNGATFEELCVDKDVVKAVMDMINEHGKSVGLGKWEIPTRVTLVAGPWVPDTGLVTAALKIRRKYIQRHYQNDIDVMYK